MATAIGFNYSIAGNSFFAGAFGALIPAQIYLGVRHKTWGFLFGMLAGLVLEVIGYVARIQMAYGEKKFLIYMVTLTLAPAFFSASIYLSLGRIIVVFGEHLSRLKPRVIMVIFVLADAMSLAFQAAGGAIAGAAVNDGKDPAKLDRGITILQVGLSVHLVAIFIYAVVSADFAYSVFRSKEKWSPRFSETQTSRRFMLFLATLALATTCILIRTAFRVAELSEGFTSELAKNETYFFALDGAMVWIAAVSLTACHPAITMRGGAWRKADFSMRGGGSNEGVSGRVTQTHVPLQSVDESSNTKNSKLSGQELP